MCVRSSFLTALISWASLLVVTDVAGQRGNNRTVAVVASRAGLFPSLSLDRLRPRTLHPLCTSTHDSVRHPTDKCSTAYGISYSSLIRIDTGLFIQDFSKHFKVLFLNAEALDICDYIMQANVDFVFLCETWLRPVGGEAESTALTPPGFVFVFLSLFPDSLEQVVGLLFYIEPVLHETLQFLLEVFFTAFQICEVRLSYDGHTAVFLSDYHPPPSRENKLTNAMFLEQFSDLLESYVSCFTLQSINTTKMLMERIVARKLAQDLGLLPPKQGGYREGKPTLEKKSGRFAYDV